MNRLHVGRGTARGALTVFPIWAEVTHPVSYTTDHGFARLGEHPGGPAVGSLAVSNTTDLPLLLLEGQLLEGGMQHRMVARSVLLAPGESVPLEVVCVEQGRWDGVGPHAARGRRASTRVRTGLHIPGDRQGEVWRRVAEYDSALGRNSTSSYVEHADRADRHIRGMVRGLHPFPGQVGILVGLAGQPLFAEIFDSPRMLARQFDDIVRAAGIDALGMPETETPGRRARRFMYAAELVERHRAGRAGIADAVHGHTDHVDLTAVRWEGHDLHTLLTNPRHELVLGA